MPAMIIHPSTEAAECGHVVDHDLSEDTASERRRCLVAILPILEAVESGAPEPVKILASLVMRTLLDLCPVHATEENLEEALAVLGLSTGDLKVLQGTGGVSLDYRPRGSA